MILLYNEISVWLKAEETFSQTNSERNPTVLSIDKTKTKKQTNKKSIILYRVNFIGERISLHSVST